MTIWLCTVYPNIDARDSIYSTCRIGDSFQVPQLLRRRVSMLERCSKHGSGGGRCQKERFNGSLEKMARVRWQWRMDTI
jgi:hypothetical protein